MVGAMVDVLIRDARREDLVDGVALLRDALGFRNADAIPPWLALSTTEAGGVALAALAGRELIGFSYAVPGLSPAGPFLLSCGLAVAPAWRSRGVGRRLKLVQRDRALAAGIPRIRWTADPLMAPALALYLSGLGARLVGYRAALFDGVRQTTNDDVDIEWTLIGGAPARPVDEVVEIPADPSCRSSRWQRSVRRDMNRLLARGLVGVGVEVTGHRRWVRFGRVVG
jgi:predicted GNAT superfamily acetyltransferase